MARKSLSQRIATAGLNMGAGVVVGKADSRTLVAPTLTESRFQAQVLAYARLRGWRAYHTYDSRRSAAGFPDLVLVRRPRVIFAELKAEGKRPTEAQWDWLEDLAESGQTVHIWRPSDWDRIEKVLR